MGKKIKHLPNVLIVDEAQVNLLLLEEIIKRINVNLIIIKAVSGFEALEKTNGVNLSLAIIDVRISGMSGYELAIKLNKERPDNKIPIIFITAGYHQGFDLIKGYHAGAVDFLVKPFQGEILISKINIFLDLYEQKQTIVKNAALLTKFNIRLKQANSALKKSEVKYRNYIDNAPDGVFVIDKTGRIVDVNEAVSKITGFTCDELLKMSFPELISGDSKEDVMNQLKALYQTNVLNFELLVKHKKNKIGWISADITNLNKNRFIVFIKDINDRKDTETELKNSLEQLHKLAQYIDKVRENERLAISRELHDNLGQSLTAIKIDLGIIRQNVVENEIVDKINKVSELVSSTIKTVQNLTSQLRPEIIDDLGLESAIEWYADEFAKRNNIEIFLDLNSDLMISPEDSLHLFRILQESLTNISRHANATKVSIGLNRTESNICFSISDNGIGITESKLKSKKSYGLLSMKERSASIGGTFHIIGNKDNGTEIKIILPLRYY